MAKKVKIVGYAKKEFFTNGIEYRNFSPDLVGNQFANSEGTPIFTSANFNISTNLDGKVDKIFVTNEFSEFMSLNDLSADSVVNALLALNTKKAKLNLDYSDITTFAFFGSLVEYVRVSLENIIINWPASLYISDIDVTDPALTGDTVTGHSYNTIKNTTTFYINSDRITNNFDINYLSGGTIINTFNETNSLRNLTANFASYIVSNSYGNFPIIEFTGATSSGSIPIKIVVDGQAFPNISAGTTSTINFHIRPNDTKVESFFFTLNEFEGRLLNRLSTPIYTSSFKVYSESDSGVAIESLKDLTWPVSDGYNIDFNSTNYVSFVEKLISISESNDDLKSNLMVRFLVSTSISEFDSIPDINHSYEESNGQKMTNTLRIYGREFDEIKNYSDGISFANIVTYDKKNNTPDITLKNLSRILGWELTSSISETDLVKNYLTLNSNNFEGFSRGLTDSEAEIELWRRIILNTPWIWKSKGTRKAIEFLFKFMGTPDGLVTFNEHLYVANNPVDMDLLLLMMDHFNDTTDITSLNVDSDGYPKTLPDTSDMYFQKAGLWYRTTGGPTPDIDILAGNNPHIGPYDGGQAYIDQFTTCLVPNFVGGITQEPLLFDDANLFTNYNNGTFDECCDSNILVTLDTNQDFDTILTNNLSDFLANNCITESACTITNNWTLTAYLTGNTIYSNQFYTNTGTTSALTESLYVTELFALSGVTELSGATMVYDSGTSEFTIINTEQVCNGELLGTYFKVDICLDSIFDCPDDGVTGLTSFSASLTTHDGCNPIALSLIRTLYHDGAGSLPAVGDTIYQNECGLILVTDTDEHVLMSGDYVDIDNWIETNSSGVRVAIVCPIVTCNVETGKISLLNGQVDRNQFFFIDGVSELRTASISYILIHNEPNSFVQISISDGQSSITISDTTPSVTVDVLISPDGSIHYPSKDYTAQVIIQTSFNAINFDVKMVLNNITDECLNNTNTQTIRFQNYQL